MDIFVNSVFVPSRGYPISSHLYLRMREGGDATVETPPLGGQQAEALPRWSPVAMIILDPSVPVQRSIGPLEWTAAEGPRNVIHLLSAMDDRTN